MDDQLYVSGYSTADAPYDLESHGVLREIDPCFDAACFVRMGRDIFWQPDVVSNTLGAVWLQRHLGSCYRVHRVRFRDSVPQHIDTTLVPLRPGLALYNPERPLVGRATESFFKVNGWQLVPGVPSVREGMPVPCRDVSNWISLNVLSLDTRTVIAEEAEIPLHEQLQSLGFDVIPVKFDAVFAFGGSFHCCTLDVRRAGGLQDYFPASENFSPLDITASVDTCSH
jgi:glycine amidinotransferase